MMLERGVSEVIGAIILISVAVLAMGIVLIVLLSSPLPTNVPSFSGIISNNSTTIYIRHLGGDPLYSGQYKILVNGVDQTSSFVGPNPFTIGTNLSYNASTMPSQVVMVYNTVNGGGIVLLSANLGGVRLQTPTFVQINATMTTAGTTVSDLLPGLSTSGDLIVVSAAWNQSSGGNYKSIADNMGNSYNIALSQISSSGANAATWYASNIKANASPLNITVTLTGSEAGNPYFEIFAAEYSGVQKIKPLDQTMTATGTGTTFSSGYGTTNQAVELIYGLTWNNETASTSAPFNTRSSYQGDLIADMTVSVMGSYSFSGTISPSGGWLCQMATFKGG